MVEDFSKIKKELATLKKKQKKKVKKGLLKGKLLKKPKAKLQSTDPKKFISQGLVKQPLVKKEKTGYFDTEYMEEKIRWLS